MSIVGCRKGILFPPKTQATFVSTFSTNLSKNLSTLKKLLPSEDILTYSFTTKDGVSCAVVYADGVVNKALLGDLIARPLARLSVKKDGGRYALNKELIEESLLFPELKSTQTFDDAAKEILDGNSLLLVDGLDEGFIVGAKLLPARAVIEPPTDIAVKGPREGFVEDIKTNMGLIRKRLKTPDLRFETLRVGKQSDTAVSLCWLEGTSNDKVKEEIKKKLQKINIDNIPDSSYIAAFLSPRKHSL
jgi:spore germination protein KA